MLSPQSRVRRKKKSVEGGDGEGNGKSPARVGRSLRAQRAPLPRPAEVSPVGADPRGSLAEGLRRSGPWDNEDAATSQFLPPRR